MHKIPLIMLMVVIPLTVIFNSVNSNVEIDFASCSLKWMAEV